MLTFMLSCLKWCIAELLLRAGLICALYMCEYRMVQNFKRGDAIEIHDRIIFGFYMGLPLVNKLNHLWKKALLVVIYNPFQRYV